MKKIKFLLDVHSLENWTSENNLEGYLKVDSNYKLKLQLIFIFSVFLIHFVKQYQKTNPKLGCLRQMKAYCYQDLKERKENKQIEILK